LSLSPKQYRRFIFKIDEKAKIEQEIILPLKNEMKTQRNEMNELKNKNMEL
jgi:hypothetical protein